MCDLCTSKFDVSSRSAFEIATAPADRIGVVASQYILVLGTLIIAVMIMISTLLVTMD
jgi:hypothetical protein